MQIDSHVPPPRAFKGKNGRRSIYPFREMKPGESLFIPHEGAITKCAAYHGAATLQKRDPAYRFAGQTVIENGKPGVRIWRIE